MMRKTGNWVLISTVVVTVGLFGLSKSDISTTIGSPWLSISQLLSLIGTVLLVWSLVLATRLRFLEDWWGGLDKVMRVHHLIGGVAFLLLISHPLFLTLNVLPNFELAKKYLFLSNMLVYNFGVVALYTMMLVLILTFLIKLPYEWWLKTHDIMGVVMFFACLHIMLITSDVSRYGLLRGWMMAVLGVGVAAYVYKVWLYKYWGPRYEYVVESVNKKGYIVEIYLKAVGRRMKFEPGQFGFVKFIWEGKDEVHPYSFSSGPDEELLRLSVKNLGDYTQKLTGLKTGTKAIVWGAYGRIYEKFFGKREVVVIAGGIGITPFLSLLRAESQAPSKRQIILFYCVRCKEEAEYLDELMLDEKKMKNLKIIPFYSQHQGHLSIREIGEKVGKFDDKIFYICGPGVMMGEIQRQLIDKGIKGENIIIEDFNLKE
jgi:predicted ferric reductase